ncbi:DgyrCDS3296 [Dimorphilus gyrociliatus]|uniref:DgyrCDS3296 n=1 Tax=Dimorphilus gyrociliatus TaxID=2664684 RepID=A0A7I8VCT1_9ANNE|nr:DgyrCDS3296 [Dimorphilus gyrociliatus]
MIKVLLIYLLDCDNYSNRKKSRKLQRDNRVTSLDYSELSDLSPDAHQSPFDYTATTHQQDICRQLPRMGHVYQSKLETIYSWSTTESIDSVEHESLKAGTRYRKLGSSNTAEPKQSIMKSLQNYFTGFFAKPISQDTINRKDSISNIDPPENPFQRTIPVPSRPENNFRRESLHTPAVTITEPVNPSPQEVFRRNRSVSSPRIIFPGATSANPGELQRREISTESVENAHKKDAVSQLRSKKEPNLDSFQLQKAQSNVQAKKNQTPERESQKKRDVFSREERLAMREYYENEMKKETRHRRQNFRSGRSFSVEIPPPEVHIIELDPNDRHASNRRRAFSSRKSVSLEDPPNRKISRMPILDISPTEAKRVPSHGHRERRQRFRSQRSRSVDGQLSPNTSPSRPTTLELKPGQKQTRSRNRQNNRKWDRNKKLLELHGRRSQSLDLPDPDHFKEG